MIQQNSGAYIPDPFFYPLRQAEKAGIRDLTVRLYAGARHELFHETNREEVFRDLTAWVDMKNR